MARIIWAEPALNDVDEIAEYIALDKPCAAKRWVRSVFAATKRLKKFLESGRHPPELPDTRYRELIVGPCRVFYRTEKNRVYILYVMRCEKALRKFLLEDREHANKQED
jgi:toxin ParE1/3/4